MYADFQYVELSPSILLIFWGNDLMMNNKQFNDPSKRDYIARNQYRVIVLDLNDFFDSNDEYILKYRVFA